MGGVPINLKCDVCGKVLTKQTIGFAKNPTEGELVLRCKQCHRKIKPKSLKNSSYRLLD